MIKSFVKTAIAALMVSVSLAGIAHASDADDVFMLSVSYSDEGAPVPANGNGIKESRDFLSVFGLAPQSDRKIVYNLVRFETEADAKAAGGSSENTIARVIMKPRNEADDYRIADLVAQGGVLEIAIREISGYASADDFFATVGAFTDKLVEQEGVVREYGWISTDGTHYVGMTQYASPDALNAVAQGPLMKSPEAGAVFANYPPMVSQMGVPLN
jgi:hypothetical protein